MGRTPQSFEKRQRERRKQLKRQEKLERRLVRNEEKRLAKEGGYEWGSAPIGSGVPYAEDGEPVERQDEGNESAPGPAPSEG